MGKKKENFERKFDGDLYRGDRTRDRTWLGLKIGLGYYSARIRIGLG